MKKMLSVLLCFMIILSFSPAVSQAAEIVQSVISEDFNLRVLCDSNAVPSYLGDTSSFYWAHNNSVSTAIIKDGEKGSNVLKITQPSTADSGATLDATALMHMDHNFVYDEGVSSWNRTVAEFSFKTNVHMRVNVVLMGTQIFRINRDGTYSGIYNNVGERVLGNYKAGEWNHVKMVFDHENKFNGSATRVFVYMNSGDGYKEYITGGTNFSTTWGATYLDGNSNFTSASQAKMRMSICANADTETEFLLDDVNIYTTNSPMSEIDVTSDFEGTALESEIYTIDGKTIKVPAGITLGDVKENLLNTENPLSYGAFTTAAGEAITENECVTTSAPGNKLCVLSSTGKAVSYYDITEGVLPYRITSMSVSKINNIPEGSDVAVPVVISDVTDIARGDELNLSVNITNEGTAKEDILVFAVYDGEKLINVAIESITVPSSVVDKPYTMQKTITIPQSEVPLSDLSLRVFVWDSISNRVPSVLSIIME